MPATPAIEFPITLDAAPAVAVAEAIAHYHRSLASDAGYALEALVKRLREVEVAQVATATATAEQLAEDLEDITEDTVTDTPERFETDAEAEDPGDDEPAPGPAVELALALKHTQEYVGDELLPRLAGWSWFDALTKYFPAMLEEEEAAELPAEDTVDSDEIARNTEIEITD
jgi:hypothetical protein